MIPVFDFTGARLRIGSLYSCCGDIPSLNWSLRNDLLPGPWLAWGKVWWRWCQWQWQCSGPALPKSPEAEDPSKADRPKKDKETRRKNHADEPHGDLPTLCSDSDIDDHDMARRRRKMKMSCWWPSRTSSSSSPFIVILF